MSYVYFIKKISKPAKPNQTRNKNKGYTIHISFYLKVVKAAVIQNKPASLPIFPAPSLVEKHDDVLVMDF